MFLVFEDRPSRLPLHRPRLALPQPPRRHLHLRRRQPLRARRHPPPRPHPPDRPRPRNPPHPRRLPRRRRVDRHPPVHRHLAPALSRGHRPRPPDARPAGREPPRVPAGQCRLGIPHLRQRRGARRPAWRGPACSSRDPAVSAALAGDREALSRRSAQRHFLLATGLTHRTYRQVQRARYAARLLQDGAGIGETVHAAGYYDQAHLTRSLRA